MIRELRNASRSARPSSTRRARPQCVGKRAYLFLWLPTAGCEPANHLYARCEVCTPHGFLRFPSAIRRFTRPMAPVLTHASSGETRLPSAVRATLQRPLNARSPRRQIRGIAWGAQGPISRTAIAPAMEALVVSMRMRKSVEARCRAAEAAQLLHLALSVDYNSDLVAPFVGDRYSVLRREELMASDLRHLLDNDVGECLETRLTGHR